MSRKKRLQKKLTREERRQLRKRKRRKRIIVLIILYFLFSVLVLLNAYTEDYSTKLWVFSGCLAVVGVYFGVLHIVALIKMKK